LFAGGCCAKDRLCLAKIRDKKFEEFGAGFPSSLAVASVVAGLEWEWL
jgi:hypothetical protein